MSGSNQALFWIKVSLNKSELSPFSTCLQKSSKLHSLLILTSIERGERVRDLKSEVKQENRIPKINISLNRFTTKVRFSKKPWIWNAVVKRWVTKVWWNSLAGELMTFGHIILYASSTFPNMNYCNKLMFANNCKVSPKHLV